MINVIKNVLCDSAYEYVEEIIISYEEKEYMLYVFRNKKIRSQVFLVLSIKETHILRIGVNDDFMIKIMGEFRKTSEYRSEMDKNISLVFCVEKDVCSMQLDKVRIDIEDDPYYFKKYVFSYTPKEADQFYQLSKQYDLSDIDVIQKYILDTQNFRNFKENYQNEDIYKMISDLIIKIPVIPISFHDKAEVTMVDQYMEDTKTYETGKIVNLDNIVDQLIDEENIDEEDIDEEELATNLLEKWDATI